ncbi:type I polyketide synthase, partial [Plectonema radiosum]|uniref:type I polyketide synthase n=1 Tax=Plectonema radiosum TaxID=945768 RepID=UPI001D146FE7
MSQNDAKIDYRSLLQDALLEMRSLRGKLEAEKQAKTEPIAIIGMDCRFPSGANSPEAYWKLLREGVDAITEVPPERWLIDTYYDSDPDVPGKMYTRYGGFIDNVDKFDPQFFGISPREATQMDPQQRLLLEVSYTALERAGQCVQGLNGSQTGVFVGISFDDYAKFSLNSGDINRIDAYSSLGNTRSIAVGRLSYAFGLQGPTMQLDTTCSSSLLATHLACQSLRSGESNLALSGGVSLMLSPEPTIGFCKLKALAPDGRCKTFDANANGYVRGEGCGIIVLKRLSDAISNGDNILAVIRGSAVNHDGQSNGLTAPNGAAQEAVIRQALTNAQIKPHQIQYVETHGTGTSLGDPIEVLALSKVLGEGRSQDNPLMIGSVKTNMGHLEAAAGVASIIKVVLSLQNQQIPPHLHFQQPNPHIPWSRLPVNVPTKLTPWNVEDTTRFAGISSFGMSGTNAHVILEHFVETLYIKSPKERPLHLLTLSAKTPQALSELVKNYKEYLTNNSDVNFADICFSANIGRSHFSHRYSMIAESCEDALQKLETLYITSLQNASVFTGIISNNKRPKIAFLFTGDSSEYINLGLQLYQTQPIFKKALDECNQISKRLVDQIGNKQQVKDTSLFAIQYALYKLWTSWGIYPDVVTGDGIGEYVAATVAGVFSLEDACLLVANHSKSEFEKVVNSINYCFPQIEIISQVTGELINSEIANASYWCERLQLASVEKIIENLKQNDCDICLEIGVESAQLSSTEVLCLPSLGTDENYHNWQVMLSSLAQMYVMGVNIDWDGFDRDYQRSRVLLPTYPFQRQRYWIEVLKLKHYQQITTENLHPLLGKQIDIANLETIHFENQINQDNPAYLQHHQVFDTVIMPAAGYLEMALSAAGKVYQINNLLLSNVEIHQALVLEEVSTTVQLILTPIDTSKNQEYQFEIFSLATKKAQNIENSVGWVSDSVTQQFNNSQTQNPTWILHASGKVNQEAEPQQLHYQAEPGNKNLNSIDVEKFYQSCQKQGINYGKNFQAIKQLWKSEKIALAEIVLPQVESIAYKLHPILLDASLQVVGCVLPNNQTYLPIGIKSFRFFGSTSNIVWSYVQFDDNQSNSSLIIADVQISEPDGRLVAQIQGLQLKVVDSQAILPKKQSFEDWLYRIEWREQSIIDGLGCEDYLLSPQEVYERVIFKRKGTQRDTQREAEVLYGQFLAELDGLSVGYVLQAFDVLGWEFVVGECFSISEVERRLQVAPQHQRLLERLLEMLVEVGVLVKENQQLRVLEKLIISQPEIQYRRLLEKYPFGGSELSLLHRCASSLASVLRGDVDGVQLLFPEGDLSAATELYQDSLGARLMNGLVQQVVCTSIVDKPDDKVLRILEIGAGTGGTTTYLLPHLNNSGIEYTFSDISPLFINKAREKFNQYNFVKYELLDIEQVVGDELNNSFDIIIAANVLHATQDIRQTLGNVEKLLTSKGFLVLLEGTRPLRWLDLIFGLTEGWWRFTDTDLRPEYPLLSVSKWEKVLQDCGFEQALSITPDSDLLSQQAVIITRKTSKTSPRPDGHPSPYQGEGLGVRFQDGDKPWLIFSDRRFNIGKELAQQLQNQGDKCILVYSGEGYEKHNEQEFSICATNSQDFIKLIQNLSNHQSVFGGIVHLWSLDATSTENLNSEQLEIDLENYCGSALYLIQALLRSPQPPLERGATSSNSQSSLSSEAMRSPQPPFSSRARGNLLVDTPIYLVTQNAQAIGNDTISGLAQSSLWGIGKVAALETDFRFKNIDIDSTISVSLQAQALLTELLSEDTEEQVALRGDKRYVARLARYKQEAEKQPLPLQLTICERGTLENLEFQPVVRKKPAENQVEIHVRATGVNFRDILNVLGLYPGDAGALGCECVGEIVALGNGVKDLKIGDIVIAIANNSFSEYVTVNALMVTIKPHNLTIEAAATIGVSFVTAYYSLHHLAKISPGDKVLIHSGAGGVGQAAIQIAQQAGAEVFTTASLNKWEVLQSMGVKHIFNSRTLDFAEEIIQLTHGEGVDIILNSLSGEFLTQSLSILKNNGRFIELGKTQDWNSHRVSTLKPDAAYFQVDLVNLCQQQPDLIQTMLRELMPQFAANQLQPLPLTVFPFEQSVDAFRYMQQAKHIGKVVVMGIGYGDKGNVTPFSVEDYGVNNRRDAESAEKRNKEVLVTLGQEANDLSSLSRRPISPSSHLQKDGTYLITGGIGGLGLFIADWLVKEGARNLVLVSRSQPDNQAKQRIQALENSGARVMVAQVDV